MSIKCLALDLDRTTLNAQGRLSPGNREALEYVIRKGIHVVIASGRSFSSLPQDVLAVPGIEYAVTSNGAAVYQIAGRKRLQSFFLPPEATEAILALTQQEPVAYEAFLDGHPYAGAAYVAQPGDYGVSPQGAAYIQSTRTPVADIIGWIRSHIHTLDSLDLVVGDPDEKRRLDTLLRQNVPGIYLTSSAPQLLEISHASAGKHSGVRFLAQYLGLQPEEIAAFGDGDNDADLLRFAGTGIAMANGSLACLAAADVVTRSHDEDGLAYAIHHILKL